MWTNPRRSPKLPAAALAILFVGASTFAAAPGQARPGEMTRADVWVRNQRSEPVPIALSEVDLTSPLRVVVVNDGNGGTALPMRVRVVPPQWDYQAVTVKIAADVAAALVRPGQDGWETTGLSWPSGDGIIVLLKRAR